MTPPDVRPLTPELVTVLRASVKGSVALPSDAAYIGAAPWIRSVGFDPAAVIFTSDNDDVAAAFRFARSAGFKVAVPLGWDETSDHGRDTLLVHLDSLKTCTINSTRSTAHFGAGTTFDELVEAAAVNDLAPVVELSAPASIGRELAGSGTQQLLSMINLSADYVRSYDVVTADGESRRVSATNHPDIKWAFRIGTPHLGIVTGVEVDLVRLTPIYAGSLWFDEEDVRAVSQMWASWSRTLDTRVTTSLAILRLPDEPAMPSAVIGRVAVVVTIGTTLPINDAEALLSPLRAVALPVHDTLKTVHPGQNERFRNEVAAHQPMLRRRSLLTSLPPQAVTAILSGFDSSSAAAVAVVEVYRHVHAPAQHLTGKSSLDGAAPYSVAAYGFAARTGTQATPSAASIFLTHLAPWSAEHLPSSAIGLDPGLTPAGGEMRARRLALLRLRYDPAHLMV